jgi:hypothetical protein
MVSEQINALSPYDPAAALWMLRAVAYRHMTALRPDVGKAQGAITECLKTLQQNWFTLAGRLKNDADAYQVRVLVAGCPMPHSALQLELCMFDTVCGSGLCESIGSCIA